MCEPSTLACHSSNMARKRHIRAGAIKWAVCTDYERLRPSCTSVLQALIFAHLQNLLYTQNTHTFWCGCFFIDEQRMYRHLCGRMAFSHSRGGRHRISGLDALRAPTLVALPSSASADFERSENICYKKPQTFWFAAFSYACGRTAEMWENGAKATFSGGGGTTNKVSTNGEPPQQALIFAHRSYLLYTQKTTPNWVWSFLC